MMQLGLIILPCASIWSVRLSGRDTVILQQYSLIRYDICKLTIWSELVFQRLKRVYISREGFLGTYTFAISFDNMSRRTVKQVSIDL